MLTSDEIDDVLALFDEDDLIYLKEIFITKNNTINNEKSKENVKEYRSNYDRQRKWWIMG